MVVVGDRCRREAVVLRLITGRQGDRAGAALLDRKPIMKIGDA